MLFDAQSGVFRAVMVPVLAQASTEPSTVPVPHGIDYWSVLTGGGPIVVGVLLLLIAASIASWTIIVRKYLHLRAAERQSVQFLATFWKSTRLDVVYQESDKLPMSPISQVFRAGYVELSKVKELVEERAGTANVTMHDQLGGMENIERALKRATNTELGQLEESVPFLATTAAAAPFVGLFGTVWGIMGAFHEITVMGNASLTTVARPISEALIATAVGLFAAIPAVVAYNYFSSRIRTMENEMINFSADFLNILKRHFFKGS